MSVDTKAVDVLAVLDDAISEFNNLRMTDRHGIGPALREARAAVADLIEDRRALLDAVKDAYYRGLMIGSDCAWALAKLQREGIYKPVCSDGRPSNADAAIDLEQIKECAKTLKYAIARVQGGAK